MIKLLYDSNRDKMEQGCAVIEQYADILDNSVVEFIKTVTSNSPKDLYESEFWGLVGYFLLNVFEGQKNLYGAIYNDEKWQSWGRFEDYWLDNYHSYPDRRIENIWYQLYMDSNGTDIGNGVQFDSKYKPQIDYYCDNSYGHPDDAAFLSCPTYTSYLTPQQKNMYTCVCLPKKDGGVKASGKHYTFKSVVIGEDGMYYPNHKAGKRAVQNDDSRITKSGIVYVPCDKFPSSRDIILCSVYPKDILEKLGYPIKE